MLSRSESLLEGTAANDTVSHGQVVRSIAGAVAEAEVKAAHFFAALPPVTKRACGSITCTQLSGDCGMKGTIASHSALSNYTANEPLPVRFFTH